MFGSQQLDRSEDEFSSPEQRALWKAKLREIQSGKNKMFLRRRNPNGGVYYVLNNGREKNIMPKHDDADLFNISGLLLNLDALDQHGVRDYSEEDEQALAQTWSDTQRRRDVRQTIRSMQHHVELSRTASRKLLNQATHPMRVMNHDLLSVALRGPGGESGMRLYEDSKVKDENGRFIVRGLTQSRLVQHHGLPAAAIRSTLEVTQTDARSTEIRQLINMGDPRKASDYMIDLRYRLGLPEHTTRDDERFLRWLSLHQSNIAFAQKDKKAMQKLEVCKALRGQMLDDTGLKRRNLVNIRRMIFQITDPGLFTTNLKGNVATEGDHELLPTTGGTDDMQNVPLMLRNAVASVLDACGDRALHYEVLTFVNNLHIRFPDKPAMAMCKYGLRLRALAGVGLLDLARQQLQRYPKGIPSIVWAHGRVVEDVGAAIGLWNAHIVKNSIVRTPASRTALLTIATGCNADGKTIYEAYHDLMLRKSHRVEVEGRLDAYMNFVELLGHLGAVRTLWYSWRVAQELQDRLNEQYRATGQPAESITDEYQIALANALQQGEPGAGDVLDSTLEACTRADLISMGGRSDVSSDGHSTLRAVWIKEMSLSEFEEWMALPLAQWLQNLNKGAFHEAR
ncbi:uncharacterized protein J7T54_002417 [Emericellopsis cladophorae]|uniref:Uncharacterized protein n=1 Tax=Emericellopsis cladophorae TaxID=2686198 RepID=A0A9Q0BF06_9HYPO|nr:uncharacterized protein J7T54_002417 [Emericellopsis cladophorae]KAI6782180.1 hypothetical protein J7T54_002417 [Emericellopsis cladophorae]